MHGSEALGFSCVCLQVLVVQASVTTCIFNMGVRDLNSMAVLADFYSLNNHVQEKDLKCERIITQIGSFFSSP